MKCLAFMRVSRQLTARFRMFDVPAVLSSCTQDEFPCQVTHFPIMTGSLPRILHATPRRLNTQTSRGPRKQRTSVSYITIATENSE